MIKKNKRTFIITGGAGFLGSNIADFFVKQDNQVIVIDNFSTSQRTNITNKKITLIEGSIADKKLVDKIFGKYKPTHVIHAAASYKNPDDWDEDVATNIYGTINVLHASNKAKIQKIVYLQTALCYGKPKTVPIKIDHPLAPITSYSISKTTGEEYIALSELPFISLRLANIYGPRHLSGPIPTFYKKIKNKEKCVIVETRRDFLEFDDFMNIVQLVLDSDINKGFFNVCSGINYSIKDLYELMIKIMKVKQNQPAEIIPPAEDDTSLLILDPSETEKTFGWKAKISLEEGLKKLIQWYDNNEVKETYTHLKIKQHGK